MSATLQPEASGEVATPRLVLFDFDGTLLHGDAYTMFIRRRYRRGWWRGLLVVPIAPVLALISMTHRGRHAAARILVRLALLGTGENRYRELVESFGRELARNSRLFSRLGISTLRRHMHAGDRVLIVTACEEALARAILDDLGLEALELVASRLARTARGWRVGVHNIGPEKLRQLAARGVSPPWAVAISDSVVDLPILAAANEAILVNPDRRTLKRVSAKLGTRLRVAEWD
jgi:phosphatidylglycerophosphatase C